MPRAREVLTLDGEAKIICLSHPYNLDYAVEIEVEAGTVCGICGEIQDRDIGGGGTVTVSIYDNHERLADLVRYARVHLHEEGLITDDEYAELALDGDAKERVKRLESYDALRERLADCERRNADLRRCIEDNAKRVFAGKDR